jgi:DNA-3-methyladenine glycosylase
VKVGRVLHPSFYDRPTELVARELLGAILEHASPDGVASGRIVETEAYLGPHDPACHAVAGRTERTWHLHGPPGVAYIYFIYGAHWCFNAVTREEGHGSAVLVRALEPVRGVDLMRRRRPRARRDPDLTNGPGKLCAALGIDGGLDGARLDRGPLKIYAGDPVDDATVEVTPRIGITRAADWPLRWLVRDNPYVSLGTPGRVKPRRRARR